MDRLEKGMEDLDLLVDDLDDEDIDNILTTEEDPLPEEEIDPDPLVDDLDDEDIDNILAEMDDPLPEEEIDLEELLDDLDDGDIDSILANEEDFLQRNDHDPEPLLDDIEDEDVDDIEDEDVDDIEDEDAEEEEEDVEEEGEDVEEEEESVEEEEDVEEEEESVEEEEEDAQIEEEEEDVNDEDDSNDEEDETPNAPDNSEESDTDSVEHQEIGTVTYEIGRFRGLPKSDLPEEAFEEGGAPCEVLGVDTNGFVYLGFPRLLYEPLHLDAMAQMNHIYRNIDLRKLSIIDEEIELGEILIGRIVRKVDDDTVQIFQRVQIVEIGPVKDTVTAVDIDDQKMQKFHFSELFWMLDHFFRIPMRGVKCRLARLEEFAGTSVISDVVRACPTTNVMIVKVDTDDEVDEKLKEFPKVLLYQSDWEVETGNWSFNLDLTRIIWDWNKHPFDFTWDMVLLETRITHANANGEVFVQFQSGLMTQLSNIRPLEDLNTVDVDHVLNSVKALRKQGHGMFLKRVDGKFRRVIVEPNKETHRPEKRHQFGESQVGSVYMTHVDYGIQQIGYLQELVPFSYFPEILEKVPPQGFKAVLQRKLKELVLSPEDIDALRSQTDIKITFAEDPNIYPDKLPVISVYFPKPGPTATRAGERPESQCSNSSSSGMSSNSSVTSDPKKKSDYQRFVLPIEERFTKTPGKQFEYNYEQQWVRTNYTRHIGIFEYSSVPW